MKPSSFPVVPCPIARRPDVVGEFCPKLIPRDLQLDRRAWPGRRGRA